MIKTKTEYKCPHCSSSLVSIPGCANSANGITLYCDVISCPVQEVSGYGKDEKAAFNIISQKYKKVA